MLNSQRVPSGRYTEKLPCWDHFRETHGLKKINIQLSLELSKGLQSEVLSLKDLIGSKGPLGKGPYKRYIYIHIVDFHYTRIYIHIHTHKYNNNMYVYNIYIY